MSWGVGVWGVGCGVWGVGCGVWGVGRIKLPSAFCLLPSAFCLLPSVSYCKVLLIFLGLGHFVKIDTELYVIYI
ncbi:hypothetical protein [Microcystis aeruginosa]|uniref:Uncharacterized protein n=1 Tax=Microcystis aeruginosa (strain NIES-843 / IAM M-2473) TaxID=449447 RepID=B0JW29_MICAN|nr:hypothetical protein [Microcystis aeruginosa]BAG04772.1 unknown protein [Microcystis aeruginosa NIES-843]